MSQQLMYHRDDLRRLTNEGYTIQISEGYLLAFGIPYLDANVCIQHGVFACPINGTYETILPPNTHIMVFSGNIPHDQFGKPLKPLGRHEPRWPKVGELTFQHGFSIIPCESGGRRSYKDFYEKVATYTAILLGPVQEVDSSIKIKADAHV